MDIRELELPGLLLPPMLCFDDWSMTLFHPSCSEKQFW
jgi:hypothetical protein